MLDNAEIDGLTELAKKLADVAALETLRHFRQMGLRAEDKDEGGAFDPVTIADRAAEVAIRSIIQNERQDDGIFGEEQARTYGSSGLTWVIDPIDGTRAFISGLPTWGTLIALDDGTSGRIGVIDQPHIGERFVGTTGANPSAFLSFRGEIMPMQTRSCRTLSDATLFTTDPYIFSVSERVAFETIRERARLTRFGVDCYAYALLAMGHIDLIIESGLQAYDIAAPKVVIEAAGGIVTDWSGGDCRWGGTAVAAATPELHAEVLSHLP